MSWSILLFLTLTVAPLLSSPSTKKYPREIMLNKWVESTLGNAENSIYRESKWGYDLAVLNWNGKKKQEIKLGCNCESDGRIVLAVVTSEYEQVGSGVLEVKRGQEETATLSIEGWTSSGSEQEDHFVILGRERSHRCKCTMQLAGNKKFFHILLRLPCALVAAAKWALPLLGDDEKPGIKEVDEEELLKQLAKGCGALSPEEIEAVKAQYSNWPAPFLSQKVKVDTKQKWGRITKKPLIFEGFPAAPFDGTWLDWWTFKGKKEQVLSVIVETPLRTRRSLWLEKRKLLEGDPTFLLPEDGMYNLFVGAMYVGEMGKYKLKLQEQPDLPASLYRKAAAGEAPKATASSLAMARTESEPRREAVRAFSARLDAALTGPSGKSQLMQEFERLEMLAIAGAAYAQEFGGESPKAVLLRLLRHLENVNMPENYIRNLEEALKTVERRWEANLLVGSALDDARNIFLHYYEQ